MRRAFSFLSHARYGGGVDELGWAVQRQGRGVVAAAKVDRLLLGRVEVQHLPRPQIDPHACGRRWRLSWCSVEQHDIDRAPATIRHIEGDEALVADGGK